jgi:glycosyltransferase involved in cell wall biosynthesis
MHMAQAALLPVAHPTPLTPSEDCQAQSLPVSVIVAARNEARNLGRCLESLRRFGEIYVVDSESTDGTARIARDYGAKVVQFRYHGGWPKKRQWAMNTLPLAYDWIFLIDADESMTPELFQEIRMAIKARQVDGYHVRLRMNFLGRHLRHSDAAFYKLALFRRGKGKFECRLREQDDSMCDMEVHEHVVVRGLTTKLRHPLDHHNIESLSRYIRKHDEYSNWEANVWTKGDRDGLRLEPRFFGNQAQRRRWCKKKFMGVPGSPLFLFLYKYVLRLGFLDGIPGLIYCAMQGIQLFQVKAKIYELRSNQTMPSGA